MDGCSSQVESAGPDICHHRVVLARRILLFCSIVLLAAALSSALTTPSRDDGDETVTPPVAAAAPGDRVTATLPAEPDVAARVGDVVELTVDADATERVEIRGLGVDAAVGPGLPGKLLVVTDRAGEFPVTLRYSGREVGTLTVTGR